MSEAILTRRARPWACRRRRHPRGGHRRDLEPRRATGDLRPRRERAHGVVERRAAGGRCAARRRLRNLSAVAEHGARQACVAVFAGGKFYVVDTGPDSVENLMLWNVPMSEIGGVFLTHFHSDHIGDLGELQLQSWAGRRPHKLDVYGGPGVEDVVAGFNGAYSHDQGYRTEHHGESIMPSASWGMVPHVVNLDGAPTPAKDRTAIAYDDGELRVTAIEVDHAPIEPAYAYRFDYKGRSVVITGDYKMHAPLAKAAAGADVLVSEALSRSMTASLETAARSSGRGQVETIMHDIQDYHISPEEAAAIANRGRRRAARVLPPEPGAG